MIKVFAALAGMPVGVALLIVCYYMINYELFIANLRFLIHAERELIIEESLIPFMSGDSWTDTIDINLTWEYNRAPVISGLPEGQDMIQAHYLQNGRYICALPEGDKGFLSIAVCHDNWKKIDCYVNGDPFICAMNNLGKCLRMIPMRAILQHYGVAFFHASQIGIGDTGILFTAPSGTGKTTQAKLWQAHRDAKLICNDRTLIRDGRTFGFPIDGSQPVYSAEVHRIGAIIVLGQSAENSVIRLKPGQAISMLMPQLVIDVWNQHARSLAMMQLVDLLKNVPVYRLDCSPDIRAVECLEARLVEEGVI